jgi:transcription termination factor Rho
MPPRKAKEVDEPSETDAEAKGADEKNAPKSAAPHRAPAKADAPPAKASAADPGAPASAVKAPEGTPVPAAAVKVEAPAPRPAFPPAPAPSGAPAPIPAPSPDGAASATDPSAPPGPRGPDTNDKYERVKREEIYLSKLQEFTMADLLKFARQEGIKEVMGLKKQEIIYKIIQEKAKQNGLLFGEGVLEVLPEGFGFLRSPKYNYLPCPDDIYISPSQIRRFGMRTGNIISGQIRPPKDGEKYFALLKVELINHSNPDQSQGTVPFESLTALNPSERIRLETDSNDLSMRVMDMMSPLGKGQRALIVAAPRTGKTVLLQKIANAVLKNHP